MAKVINLRVENILGISQAQATPNGQSLVIGGRNGQGKSSFQQAMKMALGGKEFVPSKPVKNGAESGSALIELDNGWTVEFTVLPDRKTKLTIRQDNGMKSDSVSLLKNLFGDMSFDPGEFMALSDREKVDTLQRLCGLDFTAIDAWREEAYSIRTTINRQKKQAEAKLATMPRHDDAPSEPLDPSEVMREYEAARAIAFQKSGSQSELDRLKQLADKNHQRIADLEAQIDSFRAEIEEADAKSGELEKTIAAFVVPDIEAARQKITDLKTINANVAVNQAHAAAAQVAELAAESDRLTDQIQNCDTYKAKLLADAALPLPVLGFGVDGLTYNDIPFDQLSESEQWDVATAIAFKKNPNSIVFLSRSGGLDRQTRAAIIHRAATLNCQFFMEVVDDSEDVQILIDHGTVAEDRTTAATPD